jgi:hypothetical protein
MQSGIVLQQSDVFIWKADRTEREAAMVRSHAIAN